MKRLALIAAATAAGMAAMYASIAWLNPATPLIALVGLGIAAIAYDAHIVSEATSEPKKNPQGDNK